MIIMVMLLIISIMKTRKRAHAILRLALGVGLCGLNRALVQRVSYLQ